jgi:hypothetical protein
VQQQSNTCSSHQRSSISAELEGWLPEAGSRRKNTAEPKRCKTKMLREVLGPYKSRPDSCVQAQDDINSL